MEHFSLLNGMKIHAVDLIPLTHILGWFGFDRIGMPFFYLFEDRIVMIELSFSLYRWECDLSHGCCLESAFGLSFLDLSEYKVSCKERVMKWDSWAFQYVFLFPTIGKQLLHGRTMGIHIFAYCLPFSFAQ